MPVNEIEIDKIIIGQRARQDFGDIDELANSISELGLLQPILCHNGSGETWLIDGNRRILAYRQLGRKTIPAVFFDPDDPNDVSKLFHAQYDANMKRKNFTPSEAVALYDKVKSWIETKRKLEESKNQEARVQADLDECTDSARNENETKDKNYKRTRDKVANVLGIGHDKLEKARRIVQSANEDPQNADLVQKMDQTGKVDPVYKELQIRKHDNGNLPLGKSAGLDNLPKGKIISLIVKMPDGRQKKMGSISNEWFQNKNVLQWIIENVGLGVDEKDIVIHREGNIVKVFDSTDIERLKQGIKYLVDKYSFQGSLMDIVERKEE